jgi:hypothetical protein
MDLISNKLVNSILQAYQVLYESFVTLTFKIVVPSPRKTSPIKGPSINVPFEGEGNRGLYDFSPQATSDEDSTWQAPVSSL